MQLNWFVEQFQSFSYPEVVNGSYFFFFSSYCKLLFLLQHGVHIQREQKLQRKGIFKDTEYTKEETYSGISKSFAYTSYVVPGFIIK